MRIETIEADGAGGFYVHTTGDIDRTFHVTAAWADELHAHQVKPNQTPNPALNRLRHALHTGTATASQAKAMFLEAYGAVVADREERDRLGLKPVTRHGHEDVTAVREGAEVRPWNAADEKAQLHEWMRRQRADGE